MAMGPNVDQYERASRAWKILIEQAKKKKPITYGELGEIMDVHPRVCRYFLGIIQDYCLSNNLPPIQSLVVNKHSGIPGEGYIATRTEKIESIHNEVYSFYWSNIRNPFGS